MPFTFHLIPHTHWDREWYLPRAVFQVRLIPVVDDVLEQLEQHDTARFVLDGQTVLVEDYLAVRCEAAARIGAATARGALEVGPWYVLSDLLIPTGESLLRNLLEGARDAAALGRRLDVLYSPDAFGHPGSLPMLAREFRLRFAVVRRGLGRPCGADRDLYRWESPDGQAILSYHLPRAGYEVGIEIARGGEDLEQQWKAVRSELVGRAAGNQIAVFLGADHHPAPREMTRLRDRVQELEPEHEIRLSGLTEFFTALQQTSQEDPPTIRGELRRIQDHSWILQGVHGTRARLKRRHARAELALSRLAEPLAALAAWVGGPDQRGPLRVAWRTLLQSQFHDTLCGSCCDEVALEQELRLETVRALGKEIRATSLRAIVGHDADSARESPEQVSPRLVLWNPAARARTGILTSELTVSRRTVPVGAESARRGRIRKASLPTGLETSDGGTIPIQVLARRAGQERLDAQRHHPLQDEVDRVWVAFPGPVVPGLGWGALGLAQGRRAPNSDRLEVGENGISNRDIGVRISRRGEIVLDDRRTGERYSGIAGLESEPDAGDTYTYSRGAGSIRRGGQPGLQRILASGPYLGAVETTWSMAGSAGGTVALRLVVALHADSPLVRLRLDVENRATDHRLRLRVPVGAGGAAMAGSAFGVERRAPVQLERRRDTIERPALTAPAHRFVAAAQGARGLALFAPGCFEYEWTSGQDLLVTLYRSVGELSRGDLPERPGHAGWPTATPLAQELGHHTIELALAPVAETDLSRPDRLSRLWEDVFLPVEAVFFRDFSGGEPRSSPGGGIELEGDGLALSTVKPPESGEGLVLRCYNATDGVVKGRWTFSQSIDRATLLRADETELEELRVERDRKAVGFSAGPHQMVTVRIQRAKGQRSKGLKG